MKLKLSLFTLFLILFGISIKQTLAQKTHQPTGFIYTGELFDDPDWGWSYKTSERDRVVLNRANNIIKDAVKNLVDNPEDYSISNTDMSFAFDPKQQELSKANGSKCVTCYYSNNPNGGMHFQYKYGMRMDLLEESKTFNRKASIDDSIFNVIQIITSKRKKDGNGDEKEKRIKEEMEKLQKEIENIDPSKMDEKKLAEIEAKSKKIKQMGDENENNQKISDDTLHAMYGFSYASKSDIEISTNYALLEAEKSKLTTLKNKPGFYYKELKIPGCDFACIYFDLYNKSTELAQSNNPVLIAYIGNTYKSKANLPKPWVDPFCVRLTYSGNIQQIIEVYSKIDFVKLRQVIN